MPSLSIQPEELKELLMRSTPFIDVRAPVEFVQGCLPGAVNLPILNDEERALIGTIYKQSGQEAAMARGYQLVSGNIKQDRVQKWQDFIKDHPQTVLYCFRGGKRSQISQQWLREAGIDRPLIVGGYKQARQFLLSEIERFSAIHEVLVVSGPTGSGKTELIKKVQSFYPALDLEGLAVHRGSAFGARETPQPMQSDFENQLAAELMRHEKQINIRARLLVEDESRLIGRIHVPNSFFDRIRSSQVIWVEESLEVRIENIFKDYIIDSPIGRDLGLVSESREMALQTFAKYKKSLMAIQRKLGGLRAQEILADLDHSESQFIGSNELTSNKVWIEKLLIYYYDPLYLGSLQRRQVQIAFKGPTTEAIKYLSSLVQP